MLSLVLGVDATPAHPAAALDGLGAGKIALVTGASRGIGATTARAFARTGAAVVLAARDEQAITRDHADGFAPRVTSDAKLGGVAPTPPNIGRRTFGAHTISLPGFITPSGSSRSLAARSSPIASAPISRSSHGT